MAARYAWVLNLDADLELAAGRTYTPTASVARAVRQHASILAATLLSQDDVLVDEASPAGAAAGLAGRAFCPTPRALAALRRAGAVPEASPAFEVLRRVNARSFASALGATLPGAVFVTREEDARRVLATPPSLGDAWRVKHEHGMAGRNQRVLRALRAEYALTAADVAFVRAGLARGGLQIEPDVRIVEECAIHGVLGADGSLEEGELVRQRCDARGAWVATERVVAAEPGALRIARAPMREEFARVAAALRAAGYHGPFGVDGFVYDDADGTPAVQPRSEINARYSMGFPVGFGLTRTAATTASPRHA